MDCLISFQEIQTEIRKNFMRIKENEKKLERVKKKLYLCNSFKCILKSL